MLSKLRLMNFRCFLDHEVDLEGHSVVVGGNNAGKTTISEALRLVSLVTARYRHLVYHEVPGWLVAPRRLRGCSPSIEGLQIRTDTLFHRYGTSPAQISASFPQIATIDIYIGPEFQIHAVITDEGGDVVRTKGQARKQRIPLVDILPQVGPIQRIEQLLDSEYVRRSQSSHLASLHFRNQLYAAPEEKWMGFKAIVEDTWPGLQVRGLRCEGDEKLLSLEVRDRDFVAEIGAMGHGLQMWMQTMWFLARAGDARTVILDEPDVYMHPDLQRRLIRFLRRRFNQTIVTTHSTEIMAEVEPSSIVIVDRRRRRSRRVNSVPSLQALVNRVGSVHNIQLTRLWSARRFLVVEGGDLRLLKVVQDLLYPESEVPFDLIPNMRLPGWGAWSWAVGSKMMLRNAADEAVKVMCVLDRDFHTPSQIETRQKEASERSIWLHIWKRKEVENYFLVPSAITRVVAESVGRRTTPPTQTEVEQVLDAEADTLMVDVFDAISQEFLVEERRGGSRQANRRARDLIREREAEVGKLGIVSGKVMFTRTSDWAQKEFGVAISVMRVAGSLRKEELFDELAEVVRDIEEAGVV